jgi:hypothetical protein
MKNLQNTLLAGFLCPGSTQEQTMGETEGYRHYVCIYQ